MKVQIIFIILSLIQSSRLSISLRIHSLEKGSALLPSNDDEIVSQNGVYSAGFHSVGNNAYCFAIWFSEELVDGEKTLVWMANRDQPVNGKYTKLSLEKSGELILKDAGQQIVWTTSTTSRSPVRLLLKNDGNLVLDDSDGNNLWQSFDSPTNTLLPGQFLTRSMMLVSSRSQTNHSSGFYKMYFDNDNVLRFLYDGPEITSVYWPRPWSNSWRNGRSEFNSSKLAVLDSAGYFLSSDQFNFTAADYGVGPQRRLTFDVDGNARVYSLDKATRTWKVTWQAIIQTCRVHGLCGANSFCSETHDSGSSCTCLPGYKVKNHSDWSYGCQPEFDFEHSCKEGKDVSGFLKLPHLEMYGFDLGYLPNATYDECAKFCLENCDCKGFQYVFGREPGLYSCLPKYLLLNGRHSIAFQSPIYIRLPRVNITSYEMNRQKFDFHCTDKTVLLERSYHEQGEQGWVRPLFWATSGIGALEIIWLIIFLYKTQYRSGSATIKGYQQLVLGFKKFTYAELTKATKGFSEEIGRGGGGIVYKGKFSDNRIAAIKCLQEANQGEAEFLAEVSTIGKLNHMNLIEIWGYCAEGKHRLLVYEYMKHGSLADNLYSGELDWEKRYEIAVGTAKGLAYLHEECLEWVLHCDVKPQNILLNSKYQPKVADFGMSKLFNRNGNEKSHFSRIRGTRGYMAPEWVSNLPITSKVDVYSYGIVVLEMITGWNPSGAGFDDDGINCMDPRSLIMWVKEKMLGADEGASWVEGVVDPGLNGDFDTERMEILIRVAMKCVEENRDARPTMNQVVNMLLGHESSN